MAAAPICLQVFARVPRPGQVKSRLAPALGEQGTLALYQAMLERTFIVCDAVPAAWQRQLWISEAVGQAGGRDIHADVGERWLAGVRNAHRMAVHVQPPGHIGDRMLAAAQHAAAEQCWPIIVGTDCWVLTAGYLAAAAESLQHGHDLVLGPVEDGGYVLIGMKHAAVPLFGDLPWSTAQVLPQTLAIASRLGLSVALLPTLWDVDRPEDLSRLRALPDRPVSL